MVGASYGTLAFQELQQVLSELICVLEESTVTGAVVHLQLALGNLAVHIVGVDAGHHHVGFTVDDEGGLGNVCHIVLRLLAPAADSRQLTQERRQPS